MTDWTAKTDLAALPATDRAALARLSPIQLPAGQHLFRPGDRPQGFLVLLQGRVEVFLTGPSGREILLYAVEPGQSCVQTTLGLLGDDSYSGEAITATPCQIVLIPRAQFLRLMDATPAFRASVFRAFGARMADMTQLLEQVAFVRVESRLAATLLSLAENAEVLATQADLAARIGSAREVVSRRLDALARRGVVAVDRGRVRILDREKLQALAADVT